MKHGCKPTREQRKLLDRWGLNAMDWLVVKDQPEKMVLIHRHTEQTKTIHKEKES